MSNSGNSKVFFLVSKALVIDIRDKMSFARKHGNLILKIDKESHSLSCLIESGKKEANTQGVEVNGVNLILDQAVFAKVGDVIKIENDEYKVYDDEEEVNKVKPFHERRRYKRPKNAYGLINFLNFYSAPPITLGLYLTSIGIALGYFIMNLRVEAPAELEFLQNFYNEKVLIAGIKATVFTYLLCLSYSFLMYVHFNRNALRRFLLSTLFLLMIPSFLFWSYYPFIQIRTYLETRNSILKPSIQRSSILNAVELVKSKNRLTDSYEYIVLNLTPETKVLALKSDYEKNQSSIDMMLKGMLQ